MTGGAGTGPSARERALQYLESHHVMSLATHDRDGPWAAAVFYASDGFELCFLSAPSTRHAAAIAANPVVAATIHEDYADWAQIRGIQLEGTVIELAGAQAQEARELYADKFAIVADLAKAPQAIADAFARVRWYRLIPRRLHLIDNTVAFGRREQVLPPATAPEPPHTGSRRA